MGLDPAKAKKILRGFTDEVPHAHKEIVSTADVTGRNYHESVATKHDYFGSTAITPQYAQYSNIIKVEEGRYMNELIKLLKINDVEKQISGIENIIDKLQIFMMKFHGEY